MADPKLLDWRSSAKSIIEAGKYLNAERKQRPHAEFVTIARLQFGLEASGAGKLITISRHPILSNPEYFDKLPPSWALLYELKSLPDDVLLKAIQDGSLRRATKYDIWDMRGEKIYRRKSSEINRSGHIKVPDGMDLESYVRSGMALESPAVSPEMAAKKIGLGTHTYRMIKSIVSLADRKDLNERDAALAAEALSEVNRTHKVRPLFAKLKPLMSRVWGASVKGHRLDERFVEKRIEAFRSAVIVIADTCISGLDVDLPIMPEEVRIDAIDRLTQAREAISQLRGKIRRLDD